MSGQLTALGTLSIAAAVPCLADLSGRLRGALNLRLPSLKAQIKGLLAASLSPPGLSVGAAASAKLAASLQAQVSAGLPGISVSADLITRLAGKIDTDIGALNASLAFAADLGVVFGAAGLHLYSYGGAFDDFGSAVTTATASGLPGGGGPAAVSNALVLITQLSPTWAALQSVFGVNDSTGLVYGGNRSIGAWLPLALTASLGLTASIGIVLPSLALQLAAFAQIGISVGLKPPSLGVNVVAAVELAASLALSVGLTLPSFGVQAALLGKLQLELGSLLPYLTLQLSIGALLGLGGISLYSYAGDVASLGPTLETLTGTGTSNAVLLATELPATWAALGIVLKTAA